MNDKCTHCMGVGRVSGYDCSVCYQTGKFTRECLCPGCRELDKDWAEAYLEYEARRQETA